MVFEASMFLSNFVHSILLSNTNLKMETLVMHPANKEQLAALKAIAKALKIPFEKKEEEQYDPTFVKMVKDAEERGQFNEVDPNDIWESLGLK